MHIYPVLCYVDFGSSGLRGGQGRRKTHTHTYFACVNEDNCSMEKRAGGKKWMQRRKKHHTANIPSIACGDGSGGVITWRQWTAS